MCSILLSLIEEVDSRLAEIVVDDAGLLLGFIFKPDHLQGLLSFIFHMLEIFNLTGLIFDFLVELEGNYVLFLNDVAVAVEILLNRPFLFVDLEEVGGFLVLGDDGLTVFLLVAEIQDLDQHQFELVGLQLRNLVVYLHEKQLEYVQIH